MQHFASQEGGEAAAGAVNKAAFDPKGMEKAVRQVVRYGCSCFCFVIEIAIRPWFGTRYLPAPTVFLGMLLLEALSIVAYALTGGSDAPHPPITLPVLAVLAHIGMLCHFPRIARRMQHMELEKDSEVSGPPLPFFNLLTKSWGWVRIVWEPLFFFIILMLLEQLKLIDRFAGMYLFFCTMTLVFKTMVMWYDSWCLRRDALDKQARMALIEAILDGNAMPDEVGSVNLSGLPPSATSQEKAAFVATASGLEPEFSSMITPVQRPGDDAAGAVPVMGD